MSECPLCAARREAERQQRYIDALKAQLASIDSAPISRPDWAETLTPQETALMTALITARSGYRSLVDLEAALPGGDHVADRDPQIVHVVISKVRRKLGRDVIVNARGLGWRCSKAFLTEATAKS